LFGMRKAKLLYLRQRERVVQETGNAVLANTGLARADGIRRHASPPGVIQRTHDLGCCTVPCMLYWHRTRLTSAVHSGALECELSPKDLLSGACFFDPRLPQHAQRGLPVSRQSLRQPVSLGRVLLVLGYGVVGGALTRGIGKRVSQVY